MKEAGAVSLSLPRRDKKKEVKASLPHCVREVLESKSESAGLSAMAYAAKLAVAAVYDERVITAVAPWFRRAYIPRYAPNCVKLGHVISPGLEPLIPDGDRVTRFSVKFLADEYLMIGEVAYSFGESLARTLTVLLCEALRLGVEVCQD